MKNSSCLLSSIALGGWSSANAISSPWFPPTNAPRSCCCCCFPNPWHPLKRARSSRRVRMLKGKAIPLFILVVGGVFIFKGNYAVEGMILMGSSVAKG